MTITQSSSNTVSQTVIPNMGVLKSEALSNGLSPVYLHGRLYKIKNKSGGEPRVVCAISLLNNLANDPEVTLSNMKKEKQIGVLDVQKGKIKSLTLSKDQIQMMKENGVNEIAFKVKNTVLLVKDQMILRQFTSEEEYQQYVNQLHG